METPYATTAQRRGQRVGIIQTPWGEPQQVTKLGTGGILSASCAGHGGIFVPDSLIEKIPARAQVDAAQWSDSRNWFEEDCCWAHVAVAFPELFRPDQVEAAKRTNESRGFHTQPELFEVEAAAL